MQLKFITLILTLLAHSVVCQTTRDDPWPSRIFECVPAFLYKLKPCQNGLLWCTNDCLYWVCGLCIKLSIPTRTKVVIWPPAPPPPDPSRENAPGRVVYTEYRNLTDIDLKAWLDTRRIKTQIQGRDKLFEFVAGKLGSIACKVGVTDGVKDA